MASSSSASSSDRHHHPRLGGSIPAPPPPTPSSRAPSSTPNSADEELSRLIRQLTPVLSLPTLPSRLTSVGPAKPPRTPSPPAISLLQPQEGSLKGAASELGFFHLVDHGIPSDLPATAHHECQSMFGSHPRDLSPLGLDSDGGDDVDDGDEGSSFLVFDAAAAADRGQLPPAVREYGRHLEKVGMEVVEMLSRAGGFRNPFRGKGTRARCLVWVSSAVKGREEDAGAGGGGGCDGGGVAGQPPPWGRCYPYVVCLQYEMRSWSKCLLLGDDPGWVTLAPRVDSVLVAIGDIAQVWSDGGFRKVRGRPVPTLHGSDASSVTISLLVTLPTDGVISPLPPPGDSGSGNDGAADEEGRGVPRTFSSIPFEQYAWRLFHEQFPLTDPLRRYRM